MTDIEKLKEVLLNQQERGIKSRDWDECEAVIEERHGRKHLRIESLKVTFVFTKSGRFIGAFNWQE